MLLGCPSAPHFPVPSTLLPGGGPLGDADARRLQAEVREYVLAATARDSGTAAAVNKGGGGAPAAVAGPSRVAGAHASAAEYHGPMTSWRTFAAATLDGTLDGAAAARARRTWVFAHGADALEATPYTLVRALELLHPTTGAVRAAPACRLPRTPTHTPSRTQAQVLARRAYRPKQAEVTAVAVPSPEAVDADGCVRLRLHFMGRYKCVPLASGRCPAARLTDCAPSIAANASQRAAAGDAIQAAVGLGPRCRHRRPGSRA